MTAISSRGSVILVEGLDRTGKSTQADLLIQEFHKAGKKAELIKFPGMQKRSNFTNATMCNSLSFLN